MQQLEFVSPVGLPPFTQRLAPASLAWSSDLASGPLLGPVGIDKTWCYALSMLVSGEVGNWTLALVPAVVTQDEETAAAKLPYVVWQTSPFNTDIGLRMSFGADGNQYFFSNYPNGSGKYQYRLTQFKPPTLGLYGTNASGTMTDVTPFDSTHGPNSDGVNYSFNISNFDFVHSGLLFSMHRLPDTNQMAVITKCLKAASSSASDYTKTIINHTLFDLSDAPTYAYSSGFITGYMDATFASVGSIPVTGWAVLDMRETDNALEQSDFIYPGVDYRKRWFVITAHPISSSTVSAGIQAILALYDVSVSPPQLIEFYSDPDWDSLYATFGTAISNANVVAASMMNGNTMNADGGNTNFSNTTYLDPGLSPILTGDDSFWFSGVTNTNVAVTASGYNYMFHLNPVFTYRASTYNIVGTFQADHGGGVTPPFLRLSFAQNVEITASVALGKSFCSEVRLTRPIHPQETFTQGPALGKTRRTQQFSALLVQTQGIWFGADHQQKYPAVFTSLKMGEGPPIPLTQLYSGVYHKELNSDYNFDNMIAWEICRPYPATVAMVEAHVDTSER